MTSLASCTDIPNLQEDAETLPRARAHVLVCCQHQAMVASVSILPSKSHASSSHWQSPIWNTVGWDGRK